MILLHINCSDLLKLLCLQLKLNVYHGLGHSASSEEITDAIKFLQSRLPAKMSSSTEL